MRSAVQLTRPHGKMYFFFAVGSPTCENMDFDRYLDADKLDLLTEKCIFFYVCLSMDHACGPITCFKLRFFILSALESVFPMIKLLTHEIS